jgi:hypothetical protein
MCESEMPYSLDKPAEPKTKLNLEVGLKYTQQTFTLASIVLIDSMEFMFQILSFESSDPEA